MKEYNDLLRQLMHPIARQPPKFRFNERIHANFPVSSRRLTFVSGDHSYLQTFSMRNSQGDADDDDDSDIKSWGSTEPRAPCLQTQSQSSETMEIAESAKCEFYVSSADRQRARGQDSRESTPTHKRRFTRSAQGPSDASPARSRAS